MRQFSIWTASACVVAATIPTQGDAQTREFNIAAGPLKTALAAYVRQSGRQLIFRGSEMANARSSGARGAMSPDQALDDILKGTGFQARADTSGAVAIVRSQRPASAEGADRVPAADASPTSDQVAEIVVTARKRNENLRDVPVSIIALSGRDLASAKVTQLVDLVTRVPSLTLSTASNSGFAQIRGLGTGNNPSFDQAVGKFIDNLSYGRDQDIRLPLFDVERVEVLKGPQVLLYGNSTTAGALNITTRKPGAVFAADATTSYEFRSNEIVAQGGMTMPLAEGVSLRVAGIYQDIARGDVLNILTDQHVPTTRTYAGRATLALDRGGDLKIMLKAVASVNVV